MGTRNLSSGIQKLRSDLNKGIRIIQQTPRICGNECVKSVKENFDLQGYDSGLGVEPWEKRDPKTDKAYDRGKTTNSRGQQSRYRTGKNSTYKGSVFSSSNPILEQTRNLKNSVTYKAIGKTVRIGVLNNNKGPVLAYAEKMNEGGNGTPARPYMPKPNDPPNPKMLKGINKKLGFELDKAMANLKKI